MHTPVYMKSREVDLKEYDSCQFRLFHNKETQWIVMGIDGFMEGEAFRMNTQRMFKLLKDKRVNKVLIEASNMKLIRTEDMEWLKNTFLPEAISKGFKACAFVKPLDYHARLCIENVIYKIPVRLLEAAWFDQREEAEQWLKLI
jgi:hypothetical protein